MTTTKTYTRKGDVWQMIEVGPRGGRQVWWAPVSVDTETAPSAWVYWTSTRREARHGDRLVRL